VLRKIDQRIGIYFDFGTIALPFAGELAFTLVESERRTITLDDGLALRYEILPGYEHAACTLQTGTVAAYGSTLVALTKWIDLNGWQVYCIRRDIYLQRGTPEQTLTEIQIPIRRTEGNGT
jgi:hypothetical protein